METAVDRRQEIDLDQMYSAVLKLRDGDFSARLPGEWKNRAGMVARVFNSLAAMLEELSSEQIRVANEIGTQGELGCTMEVFGIYGKWREMHDAMNRMSIGLTVELRRTSQFADALAQGKQPDEMQGQYIAGEIAQMQTRLNAVAKRLADVAH